MSRLFALVARPLATPDTPGAFLNGLRLMAVDGTVFDVPDTEANAGVLGYLGSRPGTQAAFPKARLVLLVEAGTHLLADALMCPYRMGERVRALKLLRSVASGMLLMWDRGQQPWISSLAFSVAHTLVSSVNSYLPNPNYSACSAVAEIEIIFKLSRP